MANITYENYTTGLAPAGTLNGTELVPVVQSGSPVKMSLQAINATTRTAAEISAGVTPTNYAYSERDPFRYGATGNGVADDTAAWQSAINVAAQYVKSTSTYTYGTPHVSVRSGYTYLIGSLSLSSGVGLVCDGIAYLIAKNTTGVMIDTPVISSGTTPIYNILVKGLYLFGAGSTGTLVGLRINNCQNPKVEECRFSNFAAQGLLMQSKFDGTGFTGTATSEGCIFEDVRCFNCALAANTIGVRTGQFQIMGTDHEFIQCEAVSALTVTLTGASKFRVSWNIVGVSGSRWVLCKGSVADQGWYLDSNTFDNYFSEPRADANWAEGMVIDGTNNWFEEVEFSSNGQNTNNTYDHLVLTVNANRNYIGSGSFNGIISASVFNRYAITDNNTSPLQPNRVGPMILMRDSVTGGINDVGGCLSVTLPDGTPQNLTGNSATPSVLNGNQPIKDWATSNSAATTITNFTGGFTGMVLRLHIGDANTTIQNNGTNIRTISGANIVTPSVGAIFNFYLTSAGYWQQM